MRGVWVGACAAALVTLCGAQAGAAVIFSDNFNAEPISAPGNVQANYASFANFFVGDGSVDLLGSPNSAGLTGDGNFVDLDGSTNHGGFIETISQFSFNANDRVTLSFRASGNQRFGIDGLFGGFRFFGPAPSYSGVTLTGFPTYQEPATPTRLLLGVNPLVLSTDPYATYSISFRAGGAGSISGVIGTSSNDNIGPLIDNVTLSTAYVPEPSAWALLILGFGGAGAMLRRRRHARKTA